MNESERQYHDVSNIFPMMSDEEFDALKEDIRVNGLREPIWIYGDGRIIDGRNRHQACVQLGISPTFRTYHGDDLVSFSISQNIKRRHLNESQRAMIAVQVLPMLQAEARAKMIAAGAAGAAGAEHGVKGGDGRGNKKNPPEALVPQGGFSEAPPRARAPQSRDIAAAAVGVSSRLVQDAQAVVKESPELVEKVKTGDMTIKSALRLAAANHVISDNPDYDGDEWYTPAEYLYAARRVMGAIDLDPASCAAAQRFVQASHFYTKQDDGLSKEWSGKVWLNPPYSTPLIRQFVTRLIHFYENDQIKEAIILTNNSSDTGWFHDLLSRYPACFTRGRVQFWRPNHRNFGARQGQTLFYLGNNIGVFVREFSPLGQVVGKL